MQGTSLKDVFCFFIPSRTMIGVALLFLGRNAEEILFRTVLKTFSKLLISLHRGLHLLGVYQHK